MSTDRQSRRLPFDMLSSPWQFGQMSGFRSVECQTLVRSIVIDDTIISPRWPYGPRAGTGTASGRPRGSIPVPRGTASVQLRHEPVLHVGGRINGADAHRRRSLERRRVPEPQRVHAVVVRDLGPRQRAVVDAQREHVHGRARARPAVAEGADAADGVRRRAVGLRLALHLVDPPADRTHPVHPVIPPSLSQQLVGRHEIVEETILLERGIDLPVVDKNRLDRLPTRGRGPRQPFNRRPRRHLRPGATYTAVSLSVPE